MESNIITNLPICSDIVYDLMAGHVSLLYYAHIPTFVIAFGMGLFIYIRGKKDLAAKIFGLFAFTFSAWTLCNFLAWVSHDSRIIMFSWGLLGMLTVLFCLFMFYFFYVFVEKKDLPIWIKVVMLISVLPIIIGTPTNANLLRFDLDYCYAIDQLFFGYVYVPQALAILAIIVFYVSRISRVSKEMKTEMTILLAGMMLFLGTFFGAGYIADNYELYRLEIYSLFAMVVFMGIMSYVIVQYRAFNIKLVGAQALVVVLIALIASQFTFINNPINRVLNIVTLVLAIGFGYLLVRSIRTEIKRREDTAKLATDLATVNEQLKALDAQKSEFLSIASHQLRTPLSIIKGYVSLLQEGAYGRTTKKQQEVLTNIDVSNERLVQLVDNFLDVSRLEQGRTQYSFEEMDLREVVESVIKELSEKSKEKHITMVLDLIDTAPLIADTDRLRHGVFNFVDNAIKYSEEHKKIKIYLKKEKGGYVVRVVDTGPGLDTHDLDNLFQKFYRSPHITNDFQGNGLGIYVVKAFVEAHGGRVWAKSKGIGKGSEFGFWVPLTPEKKDT